MILAKQAKVLEKLVIDNSPAILTAIGAVGTAVTAYLAGRGAFKAADDLQKHAEELKMQAPDGHAYINRTDVVKLTWKHYIPACTSGAVTVAAIVCAHKISASRAAALAVAYKLTEKRTDEYKKKLEEKLGIKKTNDVKAELSQERVNRAPTYMQDVILTGNGDMQCFDEGSDRPFVSNVESIRRVQNDINAHVLSHGYATVNDLYEALGLKPIDWANEVGWDQDNLLDILVNPVLGKDNKPVLTIEYGCTSIRGSK